jgi:hypothetical protein
LLASLRVSHCLYQRKVPWVLLLERRSAYARAHRLGRWRS